MLSAAELPRMVGFWYNMRMEKIATDTYSFERIREGGFVYVDKTAILKTLADGSLGKQFFVARPRRFGKSLAISTLQCLFEGRRELFKGLAIEPSWDWSKTYPVLKLDMGSCQAASVKDLWRKIDTSCDRWRQHPFLQEQNERVFKIRNFAVSLIGM